VTNNGIILVTLADNGK